LEDIIEDSYYSPEGSDNETQQTDTTENDDNDIEWDPVAAASGHNRSVQVRFDLNLI